MNGEQLATNIVWWNGPEFLCQSKQLWPVHPTSTTVPEVAMKEIVKNPQPVTHSFANTVAHQEPVTRLDKIIDCNSYSTLTRLLWVTAYVLRFVDILNKKRREKRARNSLAKALTATEISRAESMWIRTVQMSSFKSELDFIENRRDCCPPTYVSQFGLFLDDQHILRCKGRVNNAAIPESSKNPVLLPSRHNFCDLIVEDVHKKIAHSGIRQTLVTLRERFWVLRGREAVKRNLKKCVTCQRHEGIAFKPPSAPDLPTERVSIEPPFTFTGLDFAGPLYVRSEGEKVSSQSKETNKVFVCLFTCASTRAVHLELTQGLSVQSFLMVFRRFASRRGLPSMLISDNAKTFRSASKEIQALSRSQDVLGHLANNRVTWTFIMERAPWWGGFWERLIKLIKRCLKKIVGRSTLTLEELNTVLIEIEAVINARPITYVYDDEESVSYPLTPSQLISGRQITPMPNTEHFEIVSTNNILTKRAKHQRRVLQQFTCQWRREYLLSLRENATCKSKSKSNRANISVGDIVLVKSDSTKRAFWKIARVEELLESKDGRIRAARVKVANVKRNPVSLRRVIQHLVPLEVKAERVNADAEDADKVTTDQPGQLEVDHLNNHEVTNQEVRPRRKAALRGEERRRLSDTR